MVSCTAMSMMDRATYRSVADTGIDARGPSGREEAQTVAGKNEDTVDEGPFFRFDPVVVPQVVGVR